MSRDTLVTKFMSRAKDIAEGQDEFLQALEEVAQDVLTIEKADSALTQARVMDRLTDPDRVISFRVVWQNDQGEVEINRGWRVQYCNAIGPYKGGLRFHPSVNFSVLKFLGFEQTFKNALTGLPLGGAKGGSDFDPRGRSDAEIMRFCQAFMRQLAPYIGPEQDIPAGDINVSTREIGWMFASYKAYSQQFNGVLTGKAPSFGGSLMRTEATGYGLIYFVQAMLGKQGEELSSKRVAVSGKGNVAMHAAEKAIAEGAHIISISDTRGTLYCEDGMSEEALSWARSRKAEGKGIDNPPSSIACRFDADKTPWDFDLDIALPCATQNEVTGKMAETLVDNGTRLLAEGANMPLTKEAATVLDKAGLVRAPGKASNAGGVAVSGLEMAQNHQGEFMSADAVDDRLKTIMASIHDKIAEEATDGNRINYVKGANIAGYRKVADAVAAMGAI
ncbi:MAG: NADP-specific glutamate dehydrogenase [Pseudomonadota bacterium]